MRITEPYRSSTTRMWELHVDRALHRAATECMWAMATPMRAWEPKMKKKGLTTTATPSVHISISLTTGRVQESFSKGVMSQKKWVTWLSQKGKRVTNTL